MCKRDNVYVCKSKRSCYEQNEDETLWNLLTIQWIHDRQI